MSLIVNAIRTIVTFIYETLLPLQDVIFTLRGIALSQLPPPIQKRINFFHDLGMAMVNLTFGRIQPSLRPYLRGSPTHLRDRQVIVTGANSGIGLQIAKDLTRQGAEVVLAVRNLERGEAAKQEIIDLLPQAKDRVTVMILDTSSLESVRAFAKNWTTQHNGAKLDILVHNAGIAASSDGAKEYSDDGFQMVYATNFLGSFLLTHLLEAHLGEDARVILTSSTGQYGCTFGKNFRLEKVTDAVEPGFHVLESDKFARDAAIPSSAYAQSKGMQCAFARSLQKKWTQEDRRRLAHSFTPAYTSTAIFGKYQVRSLWSDFTFGFLQLMIGFATDVSEGAATGAWLASAPVGMAKEFKAGGHYWDRMTCRLSKADLLDDIVLDQLWTRWSKDAGIEWY